jgi:hypothetical protein
MTNDGNRFTPMSDVWNWPRNNPEIGLIIAFIHKHLSFRRTTLICDNLHKVGQNNDTSSDSA